MKLPTSRRAKVLSILGASALSFAAVLLVLNLSSGEKKIQRHIERLFTLDDPHFRHELGVLLGPPFVDGNRYQLLRNGDEIFPAMLDAIRSARQTITFETYIYWSGQVGRDFADALAERSRAGVKVHVLLDWVGSAKMEQALIDEMRRAGVQMHRYHPPHWSTLGRMNSRTHRKLLVVDGRVGFTGGVGIAQLWTGHAQDPQHWRDSHFRVEGPVVAQMQSAFMDNWIKVSGDVLHGDAYFPVLNALQPAGTGFAQMFSSSPSGGSESMHLMYLMAITAASETIDLSAAYFVPDDLSTAALVGALKRGVQLRIIVPGPYIDSDIVQGASRSRWGPLLEAGALIAEYQPTMYHCKVMIVDGILVSVGSTNFDNRSFSLNDEATLNILDAQFAEQQTAVFEDDLRRSRPVSLAEWHHRPWHEKALEQVSSWFGAQL